MGLELGETKKGKWGVIKEMESGCKSQRFDPTVKIGLDFFSSKFNFAWHMMT